MVLENKMLNTIVPVFVPLFLEYTNLYDLFFTAPCVNLSQEYN